jgi:hypothetical protein
MNLSNKFSLVIKQNEPLKILNDIMKKRSKTLNLDHPFIVTLSDAFDIYF